MKYKSKVKNIFVDRFLNSLLIPSIYLTMVINLFYNPFKNIQINSFDRAMGHAVSVGVDVSKRVNSLYFYLFILIPIVFLIVWALLSYVCKKSEDNVVRFLNVVSSVSFISLIIAYINKFSIDNVYGYEISLPVALIIITLIYSVLKNSINTLSFEILEWTMVSAIPIIIAVSVVFFKIDVYLEINKVSSLYVTVVWILFILFNALSRIIEFNIVKIAYLPVIASPIFVCLFLELANILNQYEIFINSKVRITLIIYIISLVLAVGIYFILKNRKLIKKFDYKRYYYPIIISIFTLMYIQLPMQTIVNTDYFEAANHGIGISQFFSFGKLPIVETFDAHMLSQQIGGYLYGILNNDFFGAIFSPYSAYMLLVYFLLFYFVFEKFFNKEIAFLLTMFYPVILDKKSIHFFIGFFIVLAVIKVYKEKTIKSYILYWFAVAIACFYLLDMGFAYFGASVVTLIFLWIKDKKYYEIKRLLISGVIIVLFFIITFVIICLFKNINPIDRLLEFIKISLSNSNWGLSIIGDVTRMDYVFCYILVPISMVIFMGIILTKYIKRNGEIKSEQVIIFLVLALAYVFNFSRGLVRHSLVEGGAVATILFTAPLCISMAIFLLNKKQRILIFVGSYFAIFLIFGLMESNINPYITPMSATAINKHLNFEQYESVYYKKIDRIVVADEMKELYLPIKEIFDNLMSEGETYIDFTNQSLLYALTERENPVYINQSPGLLSGESTQQSFIKQVEENTEKVVFALMPYEDAILAKELDGIQNSYRYYLVSEYISNNFKPLVKINKFVLWCRSDKLSEKRSMVKSLASTNKSIELIAYDYGKDKELHQYYLKQIPYLWGAYDKLNFEQKELQLEIAKNKEMVGGESLLFELDLSGIDKGSGNYININLDSNVRGNMKLELGKVIDGTFEQDIAFEFDTVGGNDLNYLIRVSSDFLWYLGEVDTLRLTTDVEASDINISLLKGDTLK